MTRVLITGGTGAIGTGLVAALDARRWQPIAVGRRDGDLLEPGTAAALIARHRPAALVHLAWSIREPHFHAGPENLRWLAASEELLLAFAATGGGRTLVVGTCAEYEVGGSEPLQESATLIPLEGPRREEERYGWAKRALFERAQAIPELELAWARVFFVFSSRDEPGRLVGDVAEAARTGVPAVIRTGGLIRDYLPARAVGAALAAILGSTLTGAVNVGSGRGETISALAGATARRLGLGSEMIDDPGFAPAGALPIVADISRLRSETRWRPPESVDEAVALELGSAR